MNVSLTQELRAYVQRRVQSGRYGNASEVVRAGLRALQREELGHDWREWQEILAKLPKDAITPETEQDVVAAVRKARNEEVRKAAK